VGLCVSELRRLERRSSEFEAEGFLDVVAHCGDEVAMLLRVELVWVPQ